MKRTLLSTLVACLVLLASPAAAQSWTKIEAQADVIPGSTYIITFTNDEGYYHTLLFEKNDEAYRLRSNNYNDNKYSTVESLVDNTTLFTIEQNQGKLYLYSQKEQKYLATVTGSAATYKVQLVETPEEASLLTFERDKDVLELKLSDRYLQRLRNAMCSSIATTQAMRPQQRPIPCPPTKTSASPMFMAIFLSCEPLRTIITTPSFFPSRLRITKAFLVSMCQPTNCRKLITTTSLLKP